MRIKNQILAKEFASQLPVNGTNWYREIKKLVEKRSIRVEEAYNYLRGKVKI